MNSFYIFIIISGSYILVETKFAKSFETIDSSSKWEKKDLNAFHI